MEACIILAFELGKTYEYLYNKLKLDNIIDFNDIEFAKKCGGNFKCNNSENIGNLFKTHICSEVDKCRLNELNNIKQKMEKIIEIDKEYEKK